MTPPSKLIIWRPTPDIGYKQFQEIIKDYGFDYGSVKFTIPNLSHFANAVKIDNNWYYFDTHKEPNYERENPNIFKKIIEGDKEVLQMMYGDKLDFGTNIADIKEGMIELSDINNFPAKRGLLIQKVSFFISWYGWIFIIFLCSLILIFSRKRNL